MRSTLPDCRLRLGKLRVLSGREICAILVVHGFSEVRQRGSHIIMPKQLDDSTLTVPVPNHSEIRTGTLQSIIRHPAFQEVPLNPEVTARKPRPACFRYTPAVGSESVLFSFFFLFVIRHLLRNMASFALMPDGKNKNDVLLHLVAV